MSAQNGDWLELTADDGFTASAYHVRPAQPRAGLVVVQEIFGVNSHIRNVADGYAGRGYEVIAPALFDRIERGVELGYDEAGMTRGRGLRSQIETDQALLDLAAAVRKLAASELKVGIVGYCWGGTLAFLAAARLDGLRAAVGYYGGQIASFARERPRVPVLLHFGEHDKSIPLSDVATVQKLRPELEVHVYGAGHGFNCDQRGSYDPSSAELALGRTLAFFEQHLG